jgi:alpha-tubulin suppressor-like RCC1 family protein/Ca2+-binding EF-hand superfamily protein
MAAPPPPDGAPVSIKTDGVDLSTKTPQQLRAFIESHRDEVKALVRMMIPEDVFVLFDEDGTGLISFSEFKRMLPYLDINISDAKSFRYYRMCDTDGSGEIDIDEFKVALFTCDPTNGNPVGFKPSRNLTPLDAFEVFDEDFKGLLDEDELMYALEYLQVPITDFKHENYLKLIDSNNTGMIDFAEFRTIWLDICDLKKELEDRGADVPSFAKKKTLVKLLEEILKDEEFKERRAMAEAKRYKEWLLNVRGKKKILKKASFRSYTELRSALDAGGHVYVFGGGTNKQFSQSVIEKLKSDHYKFANFDKIIELWRDRIMPEQLVDRLRLDRKAQEMEEARDMERNLGGLSKLGQLGENQVIIDPYIEAQSSFFQGTNCQMNTAALWGRRIHHIAISDNVMFALSDTGEVFTWGGNNYWWHEIQPDSVYQKKWRGDTTARSQMLMGTTTKQMPSDVAIDLNLEIVDPEELKVDCIKTVCKYFNVWEPPPNPATRMQYFEKELLIKVEYDQVKFCLKMRGKQMIDKTKLEMMEELYQDILLEKKLLGERAHKAIRELETQVSNLLKRKRDKLANKVASRIDQMWAPLREVQAETKAKAISKAISDEHGANYKIEKDFEDWRIRAAEKREELQPQFTGRGNSLDIKLSGVTPRGPTLYEPRGFEAATQIAAGTAHACLVHKSGQLYSWGVGISGRLGLDLTEGGDPQTDAPMPRVVQALSGRPVIRVSCGYSHTGAILAGGDLYMWGSAASGKCGLGVIVDSEECYCSIPTRVIVGVEDKRIKKVSCGSAHSAVVTESGHLYIYGCGDTGRLGLGKSKYETVYIPTMVESLRDERIANVSCGNSTTIVCTEIKHQMVGKKGATFKQLGGGKVYLAGSQNVFGKQYDEFTKLESMDRVVIKQVSAGFRHSALVSAEGELFCWGFNLNSCCGTADIANFIEHPTIIPSLFTNAVNIGFKKDSYQSSTYNNRTANYALNGNTEGYGLKQCTSTQMDSQAWIEIDLGTLAVIKEVKIWNRSDEPTDPIQPRDLFSSRLFPCWVMIGQEPFKQELNASSLKDNLRKAVAKVKFTEDSRVSVWTCPLSTQGRYVRVQLEGFNFLSLAQIEVMGFGGLAKGVGRVGFAAAGRDVTVAVIRPSSDPQDVETLYKRAVWADAYNADILRQLETYVLEYDKFGCGEVLEGKCSVCTENFICETCTLYKLYNREIKLMPPAIGGRRRRLNSMDKYLVNENKPELIEYEVPVLDRPTKWDKRKKGFSKLFTWKYWFSNRKLDFQYEKQLALLKKPAELLKTFHEVEEKNNFEIREKEDNEAKELFDRIATHVTKKVEDDVSVAGSSIGESVVRPKLKPGDILPSGHVVKAPMPRSITSKAAVVDEIQKVEKKRKVKRDKELKEAQAKLDAMGESAPTGH